MSEQSMTRADIEYKLRERAFKDEDFRQLLLSDPKAALEEEIGTQLPENLKVVALEEKPDKFFLVLPPTFKEADGELSDVELEMIAGGGGYWGGLRSGFFATTCTPTFNSGCLD